MSLDIWESKFHFISASILNNLFQKTNELVNTTGSYWKWTLQEPVSAASINLNVTLSEPGHCVLLELNACPVHGKCTNNSFVVLILQYLAILWWVCLSRNLIKALFLLHLVMLLFVNISKTVYWSLAIKLYKSWSVAIKLYKSWSVVIKLYKFLWQSNNHFIYKE